MMNKKLLGIAIGATLLSSAAQAVPWCHQGTIVEIADVNWSGAQIAANYTGPAPVGVYDLEVYKTFTATHNYASGFAGGGGGFGGYSVPGSGQVKVVAYAPNPYTNMVGPGNYYTSHGVSFKLQKCYTIPPLTIHHELAEVSPDIGGGISFEPAKGMQVIKEAWLAPIVDPDDDEDFDQDEKVQKK
jgi:hypothetical protein